MKLDWGNAPGYLEGDEEHVCKLIIDAMRDPNSSIVIGIIKSTPNVDEEASTYDFHSFTGHNKGNEPFAYVMLADHILKTMSSELNLENRDDMLAYIDYIKEHRELDKITDPEPIYGAKERMH